MNNFKYLDSINKLKLTNLKSRLQSGMSLLEILVVIAIFSVLGIITTRAVLLTIGGSKKSESLVRVRENLNNAMSVIERQLRNADSVVDCADEDRVVIEYVDQQGNTSSFSCTGLGSEEAYISSASARLTSSSIRMTYCNFHCTPGSAVNPASVDVSFNAVDAKGVGTTSESRVSISNQILLRNY